MRVYVCVGVCVCVCVCVRACVCVCVCVRVVCVYEQKISVKELYEDAHGPKGALKETFFNFDNDKKNWNNQECWRSRNESRNFEEMKIKLKVFKKGRLNIKIFVLMLKINFFLMFYFFFGQMCRCKSMCTFMFKILMFFPILVKKQE